MNTLSSYPDLVVVMGGGVMADGTVPQHVAERCKAVLAMTDLAKRAIVIASSSFTLNCPPKLSKDKMPLSESSAIEQYLRSNGYLGTILCEQQSHDTVGSIFFILSLYGTYLNITRITFVTSSFHAERTEKIAKFINERVFSNNFTVVICSVPDAEVSKERIDHEKSSLKLFFETFGDVFDCSSFFLRLVKDHNNYNHHYASDSILTKSFLY